MKILIVHNNYAVHSGEESVVDKMATMLSQKGHTVCFYRKTTEGYRNNLIGNIKGFLNGIYSPSGVRGLKEIIERELPDIINIHNLYPFISPAALFECKKKNIPVVMTIHNFRLICPTGLFMRNNKPCEICLQKSSEWSCVKYNCEGSMLKSIGYALRCAFARWIKAYTGCVDRFVCINHFQKQKLIEAGFAPEKIDIIPNSIEMTNKPIVCEGEYVAYIGRISEEKGWDLLAKAALIHSDIKFKFAGRVRNNVDFKLPSNAEYVGELNKYELNKFIKNSKFLVLPSRCYEGFPMSVLEVALFSKPSITPNHAAFPNIIGNGLNAGGLLFEPGNHSDLAEKIRLLWDNNELCSVLGRNAYERVKENYNNENIYKKWLQILNNLIKDHESKVIRRF